jgi:hypothetical protein
MSASVRGGLDHLLQVVEQLLPIDALGIGLLVPLVGGRLQQRPPLVELGGCDGLDGVVALLGVGAAAFVGGIAVA